jgi:hypothetical protein
MLGPYRVLLLSGNTLQCNGLSCVEIIQIFKLCCSNSLVLCSVNKLVTFSVMYVNSLMCDGDILVLFVVIFGSTLWWFL